MPAPGREAKALLAEAAKLQELAAATLKRPEEARGQARSAYEAAVGEIVVVCRTGEVAQVVEDSVQFVAAHDRCTPKNVSLTLSCRDAGTVCHFF